MGVHRPTDFDITYRAGTKKYPDGPVNRNARYVIRPRVVITDLRNRTDPAEIVPQRVFSMSKIPKKDRQRARALLAHCKSRIEIMRIRREFLIENSLSYS